MPAHRTAAGATPTLEKLTRRFTLNELIAVLVILAASVSHAYMGCQRFARSAVTFAVHTDEAPVTIESLQAFTAAWNRHDADAILSFMTEDCIYQTSAGAEVSGTRYVGREAVRRGCIEVWTIYPDGHRGNDTRLVCGDRGVSEWVFTGTRADGTRSEVDGCDLFVFRDGKIAVKSSAMRSPKLADEPTSVVAPKSAKLPRFDALDRRRQELKQNLHLSAEQTRDWLRRAAIGHVDALCSVKRISSASPNPA